jgi:hypothetical protein
VLYFLFHFLAFNITNNNEKENKNHPFLHQVQINLSNNKMIIDLYFWEYNSKKLEVKSS